MAKSNNLLVGTASATRNYLSDKITKSNRSTNESERRSNTAIPGRAAKRSKQVASSLAKNNAYSTAKSTGSTGINRGSTSGYSGDPSAETVRLGRGSSGRSVKSGGAQKSYKDIVRSVSGGKK